MLRGRTIDHPRPVREARAPATDRRSPDVRRPRPTVALWLEIPRADLEQAIDTYEAVFGVTLRRDVSGGLQLAIYPAETPEPAPAASGPHGRQGGEAARPAGATLGADNPLAAALSRFARIGETSPTPATDHGRAVALVRDSAGNRIGLGPAR